MRYFTFLLPAILLVGCQASTITVELAPSSEAQVHFDETVSPEEGSIQQVEIPRKAYLEVPFAVQAPHANWDDPYQEACEEASVIMVDYFLREQALTPDQANREILQLVNWEQSKGYSYDVTVDELKQIVEQYYGYKARISDNVSAASIMYEIAHGNPVIVPAAGRKLGNPYFSGEGPWYHMLVITGYDNHDFIVNDPGTKRGEDFKYRQSVLLNAVHDWTGVQEEIETGAKRMLIIEP